MPSLRELLQEIRCGGSDFVGPFTYGFFEKVAQALEPEDTDAPIHKLRQRAEVAESRLAEAKAEIERLRHELSAAANLSYEVAQERDADAALGGLVRGMRPHTRLTRSGLSYFAQILTTRAGGWYLAEHTLDPAEALLQIQEVGDAEA